jgi:hypothetical protein
LFEGKVFKSPSAFSVYVKRKVNPSRKADDGWTSVKYENQLLCNYRPYLEDLNNQLANVSSSPVRPAVVRRKRKVKPKASYTDSDGETSAEQAFEEDDASEQSYSVEVLHRDPAGASEPHSTGPQVQGHSAGQGSKPPAEARPAKRARTKPAGSVKQDIEQNKASANHLWTWRVCENLACKKWRRVRPAEAQQGAWYCSLNTDPRYCAG